MVIISAFAVILPDRIEEARAAATAVVAETQKEVGCRRYQFYQDIARPERFLAYEEWDTEDALYAHLQTEHVKAFFAAITPLLAEPPVMAKHTVASSGPI